ncbi:pseudo-hevein [Podospora aff. communis PSN243]|uniref:Pseudo-hevein n=1 Tax=Podospora aff. communis PSN243 TaxID=3040156 RepID=A0AAV9GBM0_9PEZI|nr:pseudo-hevein [Podospora aff. communis PSN243]
MRTTYIGLCAALVGTALSARIERFGEKEVVSLVGNHRILADIGSHRKNASSLRNLQSRQASGQCGAQAGRCPGNLCCSDYGFCGDSVDHCAPLFDCQPQYGVCGWPRPATTSAPPPPTTTSTTSAPPPPTTTSTTTSTSTSISTAIVSLPPPTTTTSRPPVVVTPTTTGPILQPTSIGRVTTNGQCGNGTVCIGNPAYGPCCSQFFWCGSSLDFCGAGCKSEFGACLGVPGIPAPPAANQTGVVSPTSAVIPPTLISTSVIPLPPTTTSAPPVVIPPTTTAPPVVVPPTTTTSARPTTTAVQLPAGQRSTTDGRCGSGVNCLGSTFGRCCSQFGWCGDGDQFCPPIVGCQPQFGICDP